MAPGKEQDAPRSPRRVAVRTLGCKVNQVESEQIAAELLGDGFVMVSEESAEVIVVNTCTVTGEADAKARKAVRRAAGASRRPIVVVTGCLAALEPDSLRALGPNVVVEADKTLVADRVAELLDVPHRDESSRGPRAVARSRSGDGFRTRAMLKIQDGCDAFCSYCVVPRARGLPRSVPVDELRAEAERMLAEGVQEIVLTGINLGRYRSGSAGLASLVRILAESGVARLRLSSIEPTSLDAELVDALAGTRAVCPHFHVPLQSGSDRVLQAMGRAYDLATYATRLEALHSAVPGVAVTTDVIAGFPGETNAEAAQTRRACDELSFARLHVFRYSERAGTPAAALGGTVPHAERARRAAKLRVIDEGLRARYAASREGKEAEVLVESVDRAVGGTTRAAGTTEDYLKVVFDVSEACVGDVVRVRLGARGREGIVRATSVGRPTDVAGC